MYAESGGAEIVSKETWMYAGTAIRRTRERRARQLFRFGDDERTPALRLAQFPKQAFVQTHDNPELGETDRLPCEEIQWIEQALGHDSVPVPLDPAESTGRTNEFVFQSITDEEQHSAAKVRLLPIVTRKSSQTLAVQRSSCPYLEWGASERHCIAGEPKEITLRAQAAYCLEPRHRRCAYYRSAKGLPSIAPERLAVYTAALVLVLALTIAAGIALVRSGDDVVAGSDINTHLVRQ